MKELTAAQQKAKELLSNTDTSIGEIAELIGFLASERNTYITGQTLVIDGGYTCR